MSVPTAINYEHALAVLLEATDEIEGVAVMQI